MPYGDANDTTVSVLRGSMKFALEIDGYNFTSMDNTLRISCKVETEGGEGSEVMTHAPFFFIFSFFLSVFFYFLLLDFVCAF